MKAINARTSARGFSLLEVLIAVAILTFGLLALASLQLTLIRASAEAKAQTTASALAKEKIEQLRDYENMTQYRTDIVDQANEAVNDVSGSLGGVNYVRNTTVQRYVYNKTDNTFDLVGDSDTDATITAMADEHILGKDFKRVQVSVTWSNATGESQVIALEDVIDSLDPVETALVAKPPSTASSVRQVKKKIFDPATDDMVIPMALGDGVNTAATNPKPTVVKGSNTVETRFDVLTYNGVSGGTATVQARVETIMVGCTCDISEAPANTVRGKRPSYWNGKRYTVPSDVADYSPPAAADTESATAQSARCTICCRDHHDPVGVTGATFSPLRVTKVNNIVTAAHTHHVDKLTNTPATATYKEACRIVRSDGVLAVATDLANDYFGMIATGDGSTAATPIPDGSTGGAVDRYQDFVLDYMAARFVTPTPTSGTEQATYNTVGTPGTMAAGSPYLLDQPASVTIANTDTTGKWLHSRGLYVDYLEQEAVDAITLAKLDTACNTAVVSPPKTAAEVLKQCILRLLPFTSINLTELADWAPTSSSPLVVTNAFYSSSASSTLPVRGNVTTSSAPASNINASVGARRTNSGLLDLFFDSISPTDDVPLTDTQPFAVGGGPVVVTPGNGEFVVELTMPASFAGGVNVSYKTGTLTAKTCGAKTSTANLYDFTCSVNNATGTAGLGIGNMSVVVETYNAAVSATSTTSISGCTYEPGTAGFPTKSTGSQSYSINRCYDNGVVSAQNFTLSEAALGSAPYTVANPGAQAESTTIGFLNINVSDTIRVVFNSALPTPTVKAPTTCTYYCGQVQGNDCKSNKPTFFTIPAPPACD